MERKIKINLEGEGEREVSREALEESKIPILILKEIPSGPMIEKGDLLIFHKLLSHSSWSSSIKDKNLKKERIVLFSLRKRNGEMVKFRGDDKYFLGVTHDATSLAVIFADFLQTVLRISLRPIKVEKNNVSFVVERLL